MNKGILSAAFGLVAVALIAFVGLSFTGNDGVSGPLTRVAGIIFSLWIVPVEPEIRSTGYFPLHEENFRLLLSGVILIVATLSGVFGVMASKTTNNSLWYSIGIIASATALAELGLILATGFLVLCVGLIMHNRKWKMPQF